MTSTFIAPDVSLRLSPRAKSDPIRSIVAPGEPIERRLVHKPVRPTGCMLFAGWGPRLFT